MDRVQITKTILWIITGLTAAVGITRFAFGLGAVTNLTDATPWGLWIGFDVMAGVALASGGFVITAIFYIMKRQEFHPLVKPAVLTAFLGYMAVIVSLLFDLGLPWNIWHMMIYWNFHSPLLEVGWCVMLYTTVLLLEFSPVPLEEASRYAKIRSFLMKFRFPLVLVGIMLSTLHQSSLGSLFLIMPFKLYPLWYSEILPILFFISAVALGLMMVSLESLTSSYLYRRKTESHLVAKLCKGAIWVLGLYFVVRMSDIIATGKFGLIFSGTWESALFIVEMAMAVIIPITLFSIPRVRYSLAGQWVGSLLVVSGMVFNRINVGGLTMLRVTGDTYFPSWTEIIITLGVVSGAALVFLFAIEKFHVWEKRPRHPEADRHAKPLFDRTSEVWLGAPGVAARTRYSFAFVLSFAVAFAFLPGKKIRSGGIEEVPTYRARGGDTLFVDGNRDGYGVTFKHDFHIALYGEERSCALCHHMNLPMDKQSGCYACHRDMYSPSDVFRHDWHASPTGANIACRQCHEPDKERAASTAKKCEVCHKDLFVPGALIEVEKHVASSYTDAMHGLCVNCHKKKAIELPNKPNLGRCATCHESTPPDYLQDEVEEEVGGRHFNRVVLPGASVQRGEP